MAENKDKENDFEDAFRDAYDHWFPWLSEAHTDLKYYLDSPWTSADRRYLKLQNREVLNFNIIWRIIKMITGYERRNRLSLKIGPSEGGDDIIASQLNGLVHPVMQNCGGYETISDAFEFGACGTGANLIEPYRDRLGNIQFKRRPYNTFLMDPGFTRRDLLDCGHIIIHAAGMRTDDVISLLPGSEQKIKDLAKREPAGNAELPFTAHKGKGSIEGKRCNYSEFWQRKRKKVKYFANRSNGMKFEWDGQDDRLQYLLGEHPTQLVSYDDEAVETVTYEAYVNGKLVHSGADPNGIDDYPHVFIGGFFCPEYDDVAIKLQGNVRRLRDPQREVSKRLSKILDMIDSQVSTGRIAEVGSLLDEEDIHASGQGKGIWVKPDPTSANRSIQERVQDLRIQDIPQGLFQLNRDLQTLITDIGCVNDSMFGTDELKQQMSGYLMKLRQGAGLVALQDLFDHLRFSKKQLGFKLVKMFLANYSPSKVQRIINQQPAGILGMEIKDRKLLINEVTKYDCTPQEGVNTETQRQAFYVELLKLKEAGFNIPEEMILEAFPTEFPQKMKEGLLQAAKQKQQAEAQMQQEKQLLDKMRGAKIAADVGRAQERHSQVAENQAGAMLDRIKAAKEIQGMDQDRVIELLKIAADFQAKTQNQNRKEAMTKR